MLKKKQKGKKVHFIFERRGRNEDNLLELEFRRIISNNNNWGYKKCDFSKLSFQIKFAGKNHNSTGLQLADLIARPIGLNVLKPNQENRAFLSTGKSPILSSRYNSISLLLDIFIF